MQGWKKQQVPREEQVTRLQALVQVQCPMLSWTCTSNIF